MKTYEVKFIKFEDAIGEYEDSELIKAETPDEAVKKLNVGPISTIISVHERPETINEVVDTAGKIGDLMKKIQ
jgi:hypothetical protein